MARIQFPDGTFTTRESGERDTSEGGVADTGGEETHGASITASLPSDLDADALPPKG